MSEPEKCALHDLLAYFLIIVWMEKAYPLHLVDVDLFLMRNLKEFVHSRP